MRLCRFRHNHRVEVGFYDEKKIVPLVAAAKAYETATHDRLSFPNGDNLLDLLPCGASADAASKLAAWCEKSASAIPAGAVLETDKVELLTPVPRPNNIFLLAGNYNEHIKEGGGMATERAETFPYVFMKPVSTTLTDPNKPVVVPSSSPNHIDWELELAVVIGKTCKHVKEADALKYVAGYTVINDISDRKFRPNPGRKPRERDAFFDWLHGKWHDSFCPCGPCITSAASIPNPQTLDMKLWLNGKIRQDASTAQQIFPVAAVIEFISNMCTLQPGDLISTGTPAGVGNSTGTYVKAGDTLEAWIASIGKLVSPVTAETP